MTNEELLALCQQAFEAIPVAANARKMLKKLGDKPASYAGNGSHILASTMAKMIRAHLPIKFTLQPGRMLSGSKTAPKGHVCVFNANLCTKSGGKFWHGDIDFAIDADQLKACAVERGENVYVLREMDARFRTEATPALENAVAIISPSGNIGMNGDEA